MCCYSDCFRVDTTSPTDERAKFIADPGLRACYDLSLGDSLGDLLGDWMLLLRDAPIDPWYGFSS
jgi:hypothetical protein